MRRRLHWIFDHHVKNAASIVRSPFGLSSTNQTWICFVIALSFGLYGLLEISCNFNTERLFSNDKSELRFNDIFPQ